MSKLRVCPNCGGSQTTKGKVDQWRCLNAFELVPMAPWTCGGCGHVWEPPAPKWLLLFLLTLGLIALGAAALASGFRVVLRTALSVLMASALIFSVVRGLRSRAPKTITQGRRPGDPA